MLSSDASNINGAILASDGGSSVQWSETPIAAFSRVATLRTLWARKLLADDQSRRDVDDRVNSGTHRYSDGACQDSLNGLECRTATPSRR